MRNWEANLNLKGRSESYVSTPKADPNSSYYSAFIYALHRQLRSIKANKSRTPLFRSFDVSRWCLTRRFNKALTSSPRYRDVVNMCL